MARLAVVTCIVGGRGSGKTTLVKDMINNYPAQRRKLILDTIDHPSYREFDQIRPELIPAWKPINGRFKPKRIFQGSPRNNILAVQQKYRNGLLVFEDCRKYIGSKPGEEVEQFIIDSKQRSVDLIFIYHSFSAIPKMLWEYIDLLTVMKTKKAIPREYRTRVADFDQIAATCERVQAAKDPHYHETIEISI